MVKTKIFGYVENERKEYIDKMKDRLKEKRYDKASKSKIIELALIELEKNNNLMNIERKLLDNNMI